MRGGVGGVFKPVETNRIHCASVSISASVWTTLVAVMKQPASAIEIFNTSGSILQLAIGSAGNEVAIPYYVLPTSARVVIAFEIPGGARLSAKSIDAVPTTGDLILNSFG